MKFFLKTCLCLSLALTHYFIPDDALAQGDAPQQNKPSQQLLLENLIGEVQKTLVKLRDSGELTDLPDVTVELELTTVIETETSGGVSFLIFTIGKSKTDERIQSVKIELKPPTDKVDELKSTEEWFKNLDVAIINAVRASKRAATGPFPLALSEVEATIEFKVKKSNKGGLEFEIVPFTIDIGKKKNATIDAHSVTIKFGKK